MQNLSIVPGHFPAAPVIRVRLLWCRLADDAIAPAPDGDVRFQIGSIPTFKTRPILDTGEAKTTLYTRSAQKSLNDHGIVTPGLSFDVQRSRNLSWQFPTCTTPNLNEVDIGASLNPRTVNSGIGAFFLDDLKRSLVGFQPIASFGERSAIESSPDSVGGTGGLHAVLI